MLKCETSDLEPKEVMCGCNKAHVFFCAHSLLFGCLQGTEARSPPTLKDKIEYKLG
jgi:hypothetical protein